MKTLATLIACTLWMLLMDALTSDTYLSGVSVGITTMLLYNVIQRELLQVVTKGAGEGGK